MLPNESLLQVLHYADYETLVLAKLAGSRFLLLVAKFAEELARRRRFTVVFCSSWIKHIDETTDERRDSIDYEPGNQASLAAACRELTRVIGAHAVDELLFSWNTWTTPGVSVIFEAAPTLQYAESVLLGSPCGSTNFEALVSNFVGMKTLELSLDHDDFRLFNWTFLHRKSTRYLRLIKVCLVPHIPDEDVNRSVKELVRCCTAVPRMLDREVLELDFSANYFSAAFGLWVIELLEDSGCEVTFRMRTFREDVLNLNESEYTIDVDGSVTCYASRKSGIVVEVEGDLIAIRGHRSRSRCGWEE